MTDVCLPHGKFIYRRNAYTCTTCHVTIVTVDRQEGATPMMMECILDDCNGMMHSHCYRGDVAEGREPPRYEWRQPETDEELQELTDDGWEHVQNGGLVIYPVRLD